jgi:hypothetical protein
MELALTLNRLWQRRIWVMLGIVIAVAVAVYASSALKKATYAAASTQMVVDAPQSALGNLKTSLVPYTARAIVYARLMTSPEALTYIGKAAGIPGNEIYAVGPAEIGAPTAVHTPSVQVDGRLAAPKHKYILRFDQNPDLPTVDIYSEAPTTAQSLALANGAVTGFANYLHQLDASTSVPVAQQVRLRELGGANGGVVAKDSGKKLAVLLGFVVFLIWCLLILYVSRIREQMQATDRPGHEPIDEFDEDMSRLLRARAEVGLSETAVARSGVRENGGHEHDTRESGTRGTRGARESSARESDARESSTRERSPRENAVRENGTHVILPYGIDGDDGDEDIADRPGSAPFRDR